MDMICRRAVCIQGNMSSDKKKAVEILERGDIFFFYRAKVNKEEAHGAEDLQRFYLLLRPHSSPLLRLLIIGRKALPEHGSTHWGFVDKVTSDTQQIKDALQGEEYETSTKGHRHVPDSKAVGEGSFWILKHQSGSSRGVHTHLVYKLQNPETGEPQEVLNIVGEASYIVQIKNPDQAGPLRRKVRFPSELHELFGNRRYHPLDPVDFLNYEGCEFLVISASDDPQQELGLELDAGECSQLIQELDFPAVHSTWT